MSQTGGLAWMGLCGTAAMLEEFGNVISPGSDFLMDGGVTAAYGSGALAPSRQTADHS